MVFNAVSGLSNPVIVTTPPKLDKVSLVKENTPKEIEKILSTEQYVRQYFADVPIMVNIAKCESHFRQLEPNGNIHRGIVNNQDVGVMQINEYYHLNEAKQANYNIYTVEGNTAFARALYEREGTAPWSSSEPCWGKYVNDTAIAMNVK